MKPTLVGFTGTQRGLSSVQYQSLLWKLMQIWADAGKCWRIDAAFHGDCIGADAQFHRAVTNIGARTIEIFPPSDPSKRAWCSDRGDAEVLITHEPQPYLIRNRAIVDRSEILIACPGQEAEVLRSGTWSTVRYAEKSHVPVTFIFPNGRVQEGR